MLERPLGGALSQQRAHLPGVANSRASNWNRPPIDRMANLNIEPGDQSLDEMIANIEHGILMRTNTSWSIDDHRNKFQFGCEFGQLIENGKLTQVVKQPNYRGISANFWRSLSAVGNASTRQVFGTPMCGKGEPAQVDSGRPCVACLRVQQYRRLRRRMMSDSLMSQGATAVDWHRHFLLLADAIDCAQQGGEITLTSFSAEQSDFIRFNAGKVRQIGSVSQGKLTLRLIDGARQAYSTLTVCGDADTDLQDVSHALATLREGLRDAPDDPHLLFDTSQWERSTRRAGKVGGAAGAGAYRRRMCEGSGFRGVLCRRHDCARLRLDQRQPWLV